MRDKMLTYREDATDALKEPGVGYARSCLFDLRAEPCKKCGLHVWTPRPVQSDTVRGYVCQGCRATYTRPLPTTSQHEQDQLTLPTS